MSALHFVQGLFLGQLRWLSKDPHVVFQYGYDLGKHAFRKSSIVHFFNNVYTYFFRSAWVGKVSNIMLLNEFILAHFRSW
jgi:hypothetical protein